MGRLHNWLERAGLDSPVLRAWALYDWANSAFVTTVIASVFPIYFASVAAADLPPAVATARFAAATSVALVLVALAAPVLGALADYTASKRKFLGGFTALGVLATAGLFFVQRGDWRLGAGLFVLGNIGLAASMTFYDALLPHIAGPDRMDRVSTAGYALGYVGGALLLALNLAWIEAPHAFGLPDKGFAARLSFLSVAIWWAAFSLPLFRRVPEPPRQREPDETNAVGRPVRAAFQRLGETLRDLRGYRQAFLMLLAFLLYNDGISTIIRMATIYGTEIGIGQGSLIAALLITQVVGVPFAFLFGRLAARYRAKRAIFAGLGVYVVITVLGYFMRTGLHFFILAVLVGMVQGGTQALSRSLFATLIPRHRSGEFFGFFGVFEKVAGIFGPAVFSVTTALTGSSRNAIVSVMAFFVLGALTLALVDVEAGQKAARAAEAEVRTVRTV
jgi:MFS transporter, UMF1 family